MTHTNKRELFAIFVIVTLFLIALGLAKAQVVGVPAKDAKPAASSPAPKLTDGEKASIAMAQRDLLLALTTLQDTPQWKAYVAAQGKLQDARQKVFAGDKIDGSKWELDNNLEFVAVAEKK
jgi:hypothetical protein